MAWILSVQALAGFIRWSPGTLVSSEYCLSLLGGPCAAVVSCVVKGGPVLRQDPFRCGPRMLVGAVGERQPGIVKHHMMSLNWGEPERAPPYDLAIRNGSMVHARNRHDQKQSRLSHMPPSITCGIWFHGS